MHLMAIPPVRLAISPKRLRTSVLGVSASPRNWSRYAGSMENEMRRWSSGCEAFAGGPALEMPGFTTV